MTMMTLPTAADLRTPPRHCSSPIWALHGGMNFIHIPLKVTSVDGQAGTIETLGDLYEALTSVNYLRSFDSDTQSWVSYFGNRDADRVLQSYEGVIAFMNSAMTLRLTGEPLDTSVHIRSGTGFIGIPRRPFPFVFSKQFIALRACNLCHYR